MCDYPGILQCTPMRAADSNTPPAFTMPAGACDFERRLLDLLASDGQRDTGEYLNLLGAWAPDEKDRHAILVDGPTRLFYS